jgi:hypothetical protein
MADESIVPHWLERDNETFEGIGEFCSRGEKIAALWHHKGDGSTRDIHAAD